jgi:hypothetical protein
MELLREYDQALGRTPLRPAVDRRIRELLRMPPRRRRAGAWLLVPAIATVVMGLVGAGMVLRSESATTGGDRTDCRVSAGARGASLYTGRCSVSLPQMAVRTLRGSMLIEQAGRVELVRGQARFRVDPVTPGAQPVRVRVSAGVIEVLGTEFEVRQQQRRGWVRLDKGRIRLLLDNGHRVNLRPGERFEWSNSAVERSRSAEPESAAAPTGPSEGAPAEPPKAETASRQGPAPAEVQTAAVERRRREPGVAQVVALRSQGRYSEALALVDELVNSALDPRSHEVLSYERGSLLEHLGRHRAACRHWEHHAARFSRGRYAAAVERTLEQRCRGGSGEDSPKETSGRAAGE